VVNNAAVIGGDKSTCGLLVELGVLSVAVGGRGGGGFPSAGGESVAAQWAVPGERSSRPRSALVAAAPAPVSGD
jgi:hypothetical protein